METVNSRLFSPNVIEFNLSDCVTSLGNKIIGVALGAIASVVGFFLSLFRRNGVMDSLKNGWESAVEVYTFMNTPGLNLNTPQSTSKKMEIPDSPDSIKSNLGEVVKSLKINFEHFSSLDNKCSKLNKFAQEPLRAQKLINELALMGGPYDELQRLQAQANEVEAISTQVRSLELQAACEDKDGFGRNICINFGKINSNEDCDFIWSNYKIEIKKIVFFKGLNSFFKGLNSITFFQKSLKIIESFKTRAFDDKENSQIFTQFLWGQAMNKINIQIPCEVRNYICSFDNAFLSIEDPDFAEAYFLHLKIRYLHT